MSLASVLLCCVGIITTMWGIWILPVGLFVGPHILITALVMIAIGVCCCKAAHWLAYRVPSGHDD